MRPQTNIKRNTKVSQPADFPLEETTVHGVTEKTCDTHPILPPLFPSIPEGELKQLQALEAAKVPPHELSVTSSARLLPFLCIRCGYDSYYRDSVAKQVCCRACSEAVKQIDAPLPQICRSEFQFQRCLGVGGFGAVWLAYDRRLKRHVAIKVPCNETFQAEDAAGFLSEARASARLGHEGIARVYEADVSQGSPFIISELIVGRTLSQELSEAKPSFDQSARIVKRLADALQHAHDAKIVHRDLKPANIIIDQNDIPVLTDFGLAKEFYESASEESSRGAVIGTLGYMSPEQVNGASDRVDGRSDIYSLGVILYELLTGRTPFVGRNVPLIAAQISEQVPRRPSQISPRVPRALEAICLKCLEKDPADRFQRASELETSLEQFLQGKRIRIDRRSAQNKSIIQITRNGLAGMLRSISLL